MRNLAPFINFSCKPNLEMKPITALHGDRRLPRVAFFAKEKISPGSELSYLRDPSATSRRAWSNIPCACGMPNCRGKI